MSVEVLLANRIDEARQFLDHAFTKSIDPRVMKLRALDELRKGMRVYNPANSNLAWIILDTKARHDSSGRARELFRR